MTTTSQSSASIAHRWRELYGAALFETDRRQLPARIDEAQIALILRLRELSVTGNDGDEAQAIDIALYGLRALRNNLKLKTTEPEAA
jgi:hypothetical protein